MHATRFPAREPRRPGLLVVVAACLLLGVLSLAVRSGLGYDPWAWLVWGRELTRLDLDTLGGPSWKPLPVILIAPFTWLGALAPSIWLVFSRAAAFAAVALSYRLGSRFAGRAGGLVAAFGLCLSADFFVTGLRGYSEPLLIALAFAAIEQHLDGRRLAALALGAAAGLLRPEIWLLTGLYGLYLLVLTGRPRTPGDWRWSAAVVLLVAAAPAIWLGLDLLGSGSALESSHVAQTSPLGSAARASSPGITVFGRAADAVLLPILVLALVSVPLAYRRRSAAVLTMAGAALIWVIVVAVMAEGGFTGRRRYLILAAALMCVLAGIAAGWLAEELSPPGRGLVLAAIAVVLAAFAFSPARTDYRLLRLARQQADQVAELRDAVTAAGGAGAVRRMGRPVVNPYVHTALAWRLDLPLHRITATWSRTSRRDRWHPPAVVFRAPAKLAGPRPVLAPGQGVTIARAGRWRVVRVSGP